jgi:hypothetical protein
MNTYQLSEFKGIVVPDGYENEGLIIENVCVDMASPTHRKKITLTLARQLQGCLILPWKILCNSVTARYTKYDNTSIVFVTVNRVIEVVIDGDPFLIAENEGEGATITIQRPQGVYKCQPS